MSKFVFSAFADEIDGKLSIQIDELNKHNIRYIEMRGVNGRNVTEYSIKDIKDVKKQLDSRNFKISAIGSPIGKININDEFEPHLDLFKHTIDLASELDTKYIRMFSFYIPQGKNPLQYRDKVLERLRKFIDAAHGSEIVLLHENEKGIYGDNPDRCLDIFKTLDCSYLRATFDPANFVQCDVKVYPDAFEILKDYIEYVHIKDALYNDHSVTPAGYGDGNVGEVLRALHTMDYRGFLSLEPHLGSFSGFSALELNSEINNMPEGGPKKFAIAFKALTKLIEEVGGKIG